MFADCKYKTLETPLANGLVLRGSFIESTAGNAAPVIHFAHGNGFCARMYEPLLSKLLDRFALMLHDAQGHGDSDDGLAFSGWNETGRHIVTSIELHRPTWQNGNPNRKLIGGGHSFGAINTWLAASEKPQLFSALWLLDPVLMSPNLLRVFAVTEKLGIARNAPLAKQAMVRGCEWQSRDAAWTYFYQRGIFKGWEDAALNAYLDHALLTHADGRLTLKCPPWMEAAIFASAPKDMWRRLKSIRLSVQVLFGDQTYGFIEKNLRSAARYNPNMRIHQVHGNHCFMQQDSAAISRHESLLALQDLSA